MSTPAQRWSSSMSIFRARTLCASRVKRSRWCNDWPPTSKGVATALLTRPMLLAVTRLPLAGLHHAARRQVRRHAQQQVDVVGAYVSRQNLDVLRMAHLPRDVAHRHSNLALQHR